MSNDDLVDLLNELIETSKDGEYGYRTSADYLKSAETRTLFQRRAEACRQAASELQALVVQHGGTADDSGSTTGAMHRGWVAVKGTLAGYTDKALLEDTESAEDDALQRYRATLDESLPTDVGAVVARLYEDVKRSHAQVRSLRDQARAASV